MVQLRQLAALRARKRRTMRVRNPPPNRSERCAVVLDCPQPIGVASINRSSSAEPRGCVASQRSAASTSGAAVLDPPGLSCTEYPANDLGLHNHAMNERRARGCLMNIAFVFVGVVLSVLLAITWWWLDDARVLVRLQVDTAPPGQIYQGESGHKIVLARIDTRLGSVQGHEVWLGRAVDSERPYGHVVKVPIGWDPQSVRVDWRPNGVDLTFTDGGKIFVPDHHFTGGR